jgi:succinate dehydrogenase/fumarate reductase flavoprotein subunit
MHFPPSGYSFDLIAIGGGFAGLVAALRGAELGLRTAVLESGEGPGYLCSSRYAAGVFHVSYHDVKLAKEELVTAIDRATGGEAVPVLAEAVAADCGRTVEWLKSQGAEFTRGSQISWHGWVLAPPRAAVAGPDWRGRGPDRLVDRLGERLVEHGGALLLGTRAEKLRLEGGRCVGLTAHRLNLEIDFAAGAVVIADGGFPANPVLFRQYVGPRPDRLVQRNAGTAIGDGLRMAQAVGAALTRLDRFYGHLLSRDAITNPALSPYPQIDAVAAAAIVVDANGRRLVDEGVGGIAIANRLARSADPLCATVVCDAPIWDKAGRTAQVAPNPQLERAGGTLHHADTLDGLAYAAGLSASGLAKSVAAYNAAVMDGSLNSLRPARSTGNGIPTPIAEPPYFAIPICAGITNTMGGIAIDGDARVLRADGSPIAGLYAAGGATGGLEGGGAAGYVGGLVKACVFGLRAAEHAAQWRRREAAAHGP